MNKTLAAGVALGIATSAEAATFNVTSSADSGAGTLRQAIADANAAVGPDTITFTAALSGSTIAISSGQMLISDSVDIQGPGSANLTIDANQTSRIFYVYNPAVTPIDVTISGLTLLDGRSIVAGDVQGSAGGAIRVVGESLALEDADVLNSIGSDGGGIWFAALENLVAPSIVPAPASLSITDSTLSGNSAVDGVGPANSGYGGGVCVTGGDTVVLDEVTLTNNTAARDAGGLLVRPLGTQVIGSVTILNSFVTNNDATIGSGGGLIVLGRTLMTIADSTIAGNESMDVGGGLVVSNVGQFDLRRSTISGNVANSGAGLAIGGLPLEASRTTIENCTFAGNAATQRAGAMEVTGETLTVKETTVSGNTAPDDAGIFATSAYNSSASVDIVNAIVANNGAGPDLGAAAGGAFTVAHSLIENPGTSNPTDAGGNLFLQDPQLGPLQDNGGPTLTMRPAATSPVVNAGDPAFTPPPATDQRGFSRVSGGRIDMGAVELNPGTLQFSIATQNVNENAGSATVTVTRVGGIDGAASAQVTVNGTSTAAGGGVDHAFAGTTVNFPDLSATPQSFSVTIVDDTAFEPPETIVLDLGAPAGATIGAPASHTITILDNDVALADLSVTKTLGTEPLTQGETVTFTISVSNAGPQAAANVTVTDTLPAQLTLISATPSTGSCSGTAVVTCNLGTLNPSATATITLIARMTGTGPSTNTAAVSSSTLDPDSADNQATATFTINAAIPIPVLDARMQMLLAAVLAALAIGAIKR